MKLIDSPKRLIILALFLFASISYSQMLNDSSYFPLAISNQWTYGTGPAPKVRIVTDTLRIHGLLYYKINYEYFRESGNKIYYLKKDSTEIVLYNFDAQVGESWDIQTESSCTYGSKVIMYSKNDTVKTPTGIFTNCIHLKYKKVCMDAGLYDSWFVKGIGEVKYYTDNIAGAIEYNLASYKLNTTTEVTIRQNMNASFTLFQNYPNPFNPTTVISYQLDSPSASRSGLPGFSHVILKVYDLLGREVATLVNEYKQAGTYNINFNAKGLSSGVYILRLTSGNYAAAIKLIFTK
jgi:hypothetical protein